MASSISSWVGIGKKVKKNPTFEKSGGMEDDRDFQEYLGKF